MTPRQQELMKLLVSKGLHVWGAAAVVGNCSQEVGINLPSKFTLVTDHGSQGIAQWRLVRLTALEQFADDKKLIVTDLATQGLFLLDELAKDYPALDLMMRVPGTRSLANLTANFMVVFERPSYDPAINKLDFRIAQAQICARDFVPPPPAKHDAIVGGAASIGGGAVVAAALFGSAGWAITVTAIVAVAVILVVAYINYQQRHSAASVAPANAVPAADSASDLKDAVNELKIAYARVAAAKAVLLSNRQEGDTLLEELKKLGGELNA